jgi:HEAT repeat protein
MPRRPWVLLALLVIPFAAPAQTDDATAADKATLRAAGVDIDGPGLLAYVKKRTLSDSVREKIAALIKQLGDEEFEEREKASAALLEIGAVARPQLRAALKDRDAEVRRRSRRALRSLGEASGDLSILPAAARVLASVKPAGVLKGLLDFLPSIEDAEVRDDVIRALAPLALVKDKPDPVLLAALADKLDVKRACAGAVLARAGGTAVRPGVRKLLEDKSPEVRRRVALALLEARDKEAVPVLIAQLTEAGEELGVVEDALAAVAGSKTPDPPARYDEESLEKYRKTWEGWWKANAATVDLAKVEFGDSAGRGYTLLALLDNNGTTGRVIETDPAGKARWTIANIRYPILAVKTRRDRVLIGEFYGNKISERSTRGTVLWEKTFPSNVVAAQRLPSGNLFVATRNQFVELSPQGKDVRTIAVRNTFDIMGAHRHRDGRITMVSSNGQLLRLDSSGRQTGSFYVGASAPNPGLKVHILENGNVVVPNYVQNRVVEYDSTGKVVWQTSVVRPNAVHRAPNGSTIIGSRLRNQIHEVDRAGRSTTRTVDGRPMYVEKR